jgi:Methyltransferase domain
VSVVGVDSSSVMIEEAQRRGLDEAVVADAHALPFAADGFDGAWADRTFQHLADPVGAIADMERLLCDRRLEGPSGWRLVFVFAERSSASSRAGSGRSSAASAAEASRGPGIRSAAASAASAAAAS